MSIVSWQHFLIQQGATLSPTQQLMFADHSHSQRLYDLSHLGLIAVRGADALTFLQGQFTNDIRQIDNTAQLTGYCNAKGRLLALFYAFMHQDTLYLQCPRALVPALIKRLRMYVLRSKVSIDDESDVLRCVGLSVPDVQKHTVQAQATPSPAMAGEPHAVTAHALGTLIRLPDAAGQQRAQLIMSATVAESQWKALCTHYTPTSASAWEALEITAGIPQIYPETQEQFVPQMVNLDLLGGINFKKGCYTGQEIVARTHYLGTVKRRCLCAVVPNLDTKPNLDTLSSSDTLPSLDTVPTPGDVLIDANGQEVGNLVRVAPHETSGWLVLAECRLEAKESGAVHWQGQPLQWQTLPYSL